MIYIKNKINHRTIESINDNDYFKIDKDKIYIKDEFNNIISFDRSMFYAEKPLNFGGF